MIYDTISNLKQYRNIAPEAIDMICKVLPEYTADSPNGKSELIENKLRILIQRYNTRSPENSKVEIHADFADLQMLLDGREMIGYADVDELECLTPYNAEGDCALFAAEPEKITACDLKPGNFTIFLPGEGHMPGCGDGSPVVKMVVKIHKSLLK